MRISTATGTYTQECTSFNIAYGATNEVVASSDAYVSALSFSDIESGGSINFVKGTFT